jgi:predicted nucleic acid-binding protein
VARQSRSRPLRERLLSLLATHPVAGRQVHDANIVATMLANGITRLLTFNIADFRRFAGLIAIESP